MTQPSPVAQRPHDPPAAVAQDPYGRPGPVALDPPVPPAAVAHDPYGRPGPVAEAPGTADPVVLIAGAVSCWSPSLSPDGRRLAYVSDRSGLPRLEVTTVAQDTPGRLVSLPEQEVISVAWSPDGQWLSYLVSPAGSIRAELHAVRPDGSQARRLAGADPMATVFAGCWTRRDGWYAFTLADGHTADADAVMVDVRTGQTRTIARGGFLVVTGASPDGRHFLVRRGPRGHRHLMLADAQTGEQRRVLESTVPQDHPDTSDDGRFSADGRRIYLRTEVLRERTVLACVDLDDDGRPLPMQVLAERADADLESYAVLGDERCALLVWNVDGRSEVVLHDLERDEPVRRASGVGAVVLGWSLSADGSTAVLNGSGPRTPRGMSLLTLPDGSARRLPVTPKLRTSGVRLVRPSLERYTGLDGLSLEGWLYRPRGRTGPGPTVVIFHGGPEAQERPAYSPVHQSLVSAGITVFAPNVRGSSGYGSSFLRLDDGPMRLGALGDVDATAVFLLRAGIAAPDRLGVHGWSYGGYLALTALARWPQLFTAGCSVCGMSDLRTFYAGTERWMAQAAVPEYGDPATEQDLLAELSPMTHLENVVTPMLFVHGDVDTNVPVRESLQAFEALRARGIETELLLLPGEGHSIVGLDSRIRMTEEIVGWFDRWL